MILLDSILKIDENFYLQAFFKKNANRLKKVIRHIIDDLENSSGDSDKE